MKKINVLHIGIGGDIGGGEQYLLLLADNINKERYKLFFVSPEQRTFANELKRRNLETLIVNMKTKFNIKTLFQIRRFIRDRKIKIVHTHGTRGSFYGRLAAKWAGAPIIISTVHTSLYEYPVARLKKRIYIFLDRLTAHFCDKIICVAKVLADNLIDKSKINPNKVLVIYNGIDLKKFNQISDTSYLLKEFNIMGEDKKIGIIGRLTLEKGPIYFLEAAAQVRKFFPNLKCLIVGDGPLRKELEGISEELGISRNCIFTGIRHDIPQILSILDLLVLSSLSEGFPMILLEARVVRCPIVATKVGGVSELLENGKRGILVEPKDSQALAKAIVNLLQNSKKAKEMAYASHLAVEKKFTVDQMVKKIENVYEDLIKKKNV